MAILTLQTLAMGEWTEEKGARADEKRYKERKTKSCKALIVTLQQSNNCYDLKSSAKSLIYSNAPARMQSCLSFLSVDDKKAAEEAYIVAYKKMADIETINFKTCAPIVSDAILRESFRTEIELDNTLHRLQRERINAGHNTRENKKNIGNLKQELASMADYDKDYFSIITSGHIHKKGTSNNPFSTMYILDVDGSLEVKLKDLKNRVVQTAAGTWKQDQKYIKLYITDYNEGEKYTFLEGTVMLKNSLGNGKKALWASGDSKEFTALCTTSFDKTDRLPNYGQYRCTLGNGNKVLYSLEQHGHKWISTKRTTDNKRLVVSGKLRTDEKNGQILLYENGVSPDLKDGWSVKIVKTIDGGNRHHFEYNDQSGTKYRCR